MGNITAKLQAYYPVASNNPDFVVVTAFSNNFVEVAFDKNTHTFGENFTLTSQEKVSNDGTIFRIEKVGPLYSSVAKN